MNPHNKKFLDCFFSFTVLILLIGIFISLSSIKAMAYSYQVSSSGGGEVSCVEGIVTCDNGLVPVCSDPTFVPQCLGGVPDNPIECCKSNGISFECMVEIPTCQNVAFAPPETSDPSSVVKTFCEDGVAFCKGSNIPVTCGDPLLFPKCLPSGGTTDHVECCESRGDSIYCRPEVPLICPTDASLEKFQTVNIDVVSNPELPDIIDPPLITDEFLGRAGIAYVGAVASFEIKLPEGDPDLTVVSIDIKDSTEFIFNNVPFIVTAIEGQPEKLILELRLPDSIAPGEARFALNLSDRSFLVGVVEIVRALDIATFKSSGADVKFISKPRISRVSVKKNKKKDTISLTVKGKNFVGSTFLIQEGENFNLIENTVASQSTVVTLFPSSLNARLTKVSVSKGGKRLKVKYDLPGDVEDKIKASLVVSTPAGTTSKLFNIKPDFKIKGTKIKVRGEAFCSNSKVVCKNGGKPFCTNSAFKPKCIGGFPDPIPDCCKDEDRFFDCKAFLLRCTAR